MGTVPILHDGVTKQKIGIWEYESQIPGINMDQG